ncbi:hypothetical protein CAPTEDRAFT_208495 [Capitella teleta]|uniref:Uncharacterized protein n=1 Tax=Capitella teleta TaxID=283909 RepID=R7TZ25_CAPTE|nr:hypothetical protein CAPTEDRAFT_208495 [Capitella teleta]|eukprot:ELT99004.1 hypothetical protein CAPTEDRAFT_208495 [Capitella teleta]
MEVDSDDDLPCCQLLGVNVNAVESSDDIDISRAMNALHVDQKIQWATAKSEIVDSHSGEKIFQTKLLNFSKLTPKLFNFTPGKSVLDKTLASCGPVMFVEDDQTASMISSNLTKSAHLMKWSPSFDNILKIFSVLGIDMNFIDGSNINMDENIGADCQKEIQLKPDRFRSVIWVLTNCFQQKRYIIQVTFYSLQEEMKNVYHWLFELFTEKHFIDSLGSLVKSAINLTAHHHNWVYLCQTFGSSRRPRMFQRCLSFEAVHQVFRTESPLYVPSELAVRHIIPILKQINLKSKSNSMYEYSSILHLVNIFVGMEECASSDKAHYQNLIHHICCISADTKEHSAPDYFKLNAQTIHLKMALTKKLHAASSKPVYGTLDSWRKEAEPMTVQLAGSTLNSQTSTEDTI